MTRSRSTSDAVRLVLLGLWVIVYSPFSAVGQVFAPPDREQPGDAMIGQYLAQETAKIEPASPAEAQSFELLERNRERLKREYFYMLGLWPLPEKTPLAAQVTGSMECDGFVVDMLHFQSRPRLYGTGNLYRPAKTVPGERRPAVLVVCGHAGQGRDGNKTAYQFLGIWFARHGYVCLVLDTLQLGEIAAIHHGTYREQRWWWHSRGYTSAGVECWNGVRAIDYLQSRDDVDPKRIAVTGISGGGAATLWIAAADERVTACVPVSGMADLQAYVSNRFINGHCDCMLMYNTYQWPWARIAALVAPRAMLFTNSDDDRIFPMDANDRIANYLERAYSVFGAGDRVDAFVSRGGHDYRQDIRQASYRFVNTHLKGETAVVLDSEVDLVAKDDDGRSGAIAREKLRVFPTDADLPPDELNTQIDRHFVPMADVAPPGSGDFVNWKKKLLDQLQATTFRALPERIEPAKLAGRHGENSEWLSSEPGIRFVLRRETSVELAATKRIVLLIDGDEKDDVAETLKFVADTDDAIFVCQPRGVGDTRWTRKNPPNYVERSLALLGRTADTGRLWDIASAARYLKSTAKPGIPLVAVGRGPSAALAAYAALWEPEIDEVVLVKPSLTHMDSQSPQFLSVLRTCDIPDMLGMLAPRPLQLIDVEHDALSKVTAIYQAAGAESALKSQRPDR